MNCRISDNGSRPKLKPGCGLRIVTQLARSLGGRLKSDLDAERTSLVIRFPLSERERRPNHIVSRNARTKRHLKAARSLCSPLAAAPLAGGDSHALQPHGRLMPIYTTGEGCVMKKRAVRLLDDGLKASKRYL